MSETQIKGLAELKKVLEGLPAKLEANIMRGALRAGAKVIATQAKALVPVGAPNDRNAVRYGGRPGLLRDSIRIGTKIDRKSGSVLATVSAGGKVKGGDAYYAHMVEWGTRPHIIKIRVPNGNSAKGGQPKSWTTLTLQHPGARAQPFMRPALDATSTAAVEAVREYIRKRLADKHGIDVPAPREEGDE